jgi:hypothetical protein
LALDKLELQGQRDGWVAEVTYLKAEKILESCLRGLATRHDSQVRVFLSYAWYSGKENAALQGRLKQLKLWLQMAGVVNVFLDVSGDMWGDLNHTMSKAMAEADFCVSVGTLRLKTRAEETGNRNNVQYELGLVWKRCQSSPNFLLPVLFDGDFGQSFPDALLSCWYTEPQDEKEKAPNAPLSFPARVGCLEVQLFAEARAGGLLSRLKALEEVMFGAARSGTMPLRVTALEDALAT